MAALEARGLGKRFGARWALRGLDLALEPGEVAALAGDNGAGKSTLLRCAATLARPTEGRLAVAGVDARTDGAQARARLGFAGDAPRLYGDLTVEENLRFAARFFPGGPDRVPRLLEEVGLAPRAHDRARALSRGQAQRACLARALVGKPALLLLDEPFGGLDAPSAEVVQALLARAAAQGVAVLASAHRPEALPRACTRLVLLRDGAVALDARGGPDQLRARWAEAREGKA